jgi:hypothetical protein
MHIFDEIRTQNLDRRQLHLTVLASMTITVLATGVALLMYPTIFSRDIILSSQTLRFAFYGFCLLSVLLVGYLWDRQLTIRHLTQQVQAEQRRNSALRLNASNDLLNMIPGIRGFHEQLYTHSRRADSKVAALSVAVVRLYLSGMIADKGEQQIAFGDAVQVIHRRLRKEDSISTLSPGVYGIILPGMDALAAQRFTASIDLGLQDAAGVDKRFTADIQLLNSGDHGRSVQDLERAVAELLPRELTTVQG